MKTIRQYTVEVMTANPRSMRNDIHHMVEEAMGHEVKPGSISGALSGLASKGLLEVEKGAGYGKNAYTIKAADPETRANPLLKMKWVSSPTSDEFRPEWC